MDEWMDGWMIGMIRNMSHVDNEKTPFLRFIHFYACLKLVDVICSHVSQVSKSCHDIRRAYSSFSELPAPFALSNIPSTSAYPSEVERLEAGHTYRGTRTVDVESYLYCAYDSVD